jgi:multicomponent Na+:H+ antiporter subunit D
MSPPTAILICLLAPLVAGLAALAAGPRRKVAAGLATAAAAAGTAASLVIIAAVHGGEVPVVHFGNWPAPYGIAFAADGLAALMLAVSNFVTLAVTIYSWRGVSSFFRRRRFHVLILTLQFGVNGAFLTTDLFNLYVWFEVLLLSSFVLMSTVRGAEARAGAWRYVLLNLVSSLLFLGAAGIIYGKTGTLNMAHLATLFRGSEDSFLLLSSSALLFAAFAIKSALIPFSFWLPASYPHAPIAVSALFAGLLTKVGVYAFFRCFGLVFADGSSFAHQDVLLVLAIVTMVGGVLGAVAQDSMRRILSFHIISQVGYMILALALFTPLALAAGIFYIVHHIVVKTNLFLVAGLVEQHSGSSELSEARGVLRSFPFAAAVFAVAALSLAGLPPLSGFWAKFSLLEAALKAGAWWSTGAILLVGLLTLFSMLKIWTKVFWREPDDSPRESVTASMLVPGAVLALVTILLGVSAGPLFSFAEQAAASLLEPAGYIEAVLGANPPPVPTAISLQP